MFNDGPREEVTGEEGTDGFARSCWCYENGRDPVLQNLPPDLICEDEFGWHGIEEPETEPPSSPPARIRACCSSGIGATDPQCELCCVSQTTICSIVRNGFDGLPPNTNPCAGLVCCSTCIDDQGNLLAGIPSLRFENGVPVCKCVQDPRSCGINSDSGDDPCDVQFCQDCLFGPLPSCRPGELSTPFQGTSPLTDFSSSSWLIDPTTGLCTLFACDSSLSPCFDPTYTACEAPE
jgi:hypothetical protein